MTVHRFMSAREYNALTSGQVLFNHSHHRGNLTTSVGFCFFTEDPDEAIHWLSGITEPDYCVTMEIDERFLKKAIGHYRNPKGGVIDRIEYCTVMYSVKIAKVIHATTRFKNRAEMRRLLLQLGIPL